MYLHSRLTSKKETSRLDEINQKGCCLMHQKQETKKGKKNISKNDLQDLHSSNQQLFQIEKTYPLGE